MLACTLELKFLEAFPIKTKEYVFQEKQVHSIESTVGNTAWFQGAPVRCVRITMPCED